MLPPAFGAKSRLFSADADSTRIGVLAAPTGEESSNTSAGTGKGGPDGTGIR
jgi:hypothetical protein